MAASTLFQFGKSSSLWTSKKLLTSARLCSFQAFGINDVLVERLANLGIQRPTEIQEKALPTVMSGYNTIINAETGSGKTLCYALPIISNLMKNPYLLNKPPYAVVLLPTIELCTQVASVFKSLAEPDMNPCIVHRDSKLLIGQNYPVVMAMPSAILKYDLDSLNNVRMVVTDEADFLTTSGGKDVWKLLNYFKHGKHLKKGGYGSKKAHGKQSSNNRIDSRIIPERQFLFVAATLPSRGKMASLNVLGKWIPRTQVVTSSIVHQKIPSLDALNVKVTQDTKLPQLLSTLNKLACLVKEDGTNVAEKCDTVNGNAEQQLLKAHTNLEMVKENFDISQTNYNGELEMKSNEALISKGKSVGLRVIVFANTAQQASKAFQYLSNVGSDETNIDNHVLNNNHVKKTRQRKHMADECLNAKHLDHDSDDTDFNKQGECNDKNKEFNSRDYWKNKCAELHKDVPIMKRLESLEKFKCGELEVLICTDIASRGLDIPDVSHVVQLDFATNAAIYLHRTGRTARAGSAGKVINFITPEDEDLARALRACDDNTSDVNYEATFSRNRMFRRRIKANTVPLADSV